MQHERPEGQPSFFTGSDEETSFVDLLRREVWIDGAIAPGFSSSIIRGMRQLFQISSEAPITVFLNSDGGDPHEAMAVADYLTAFNKQLVIKTSVIGVCYSAATLIAGAGTVGHRYAIPSAEWLIHQLSHGGVGGKIDVTEQQIVHLKSINNKIGRHLAKITGSNLSTIEALMNKESYLSITEAQAIGLVDKVAIL